MEQNNNFNGDAKFFEEQEAKHKAFFESLNTPTPDEDFFKQQEAKHKAFFENANNNPSTPNTTTSNSGMAMQKVDDRTVSAIVNSLSKKGISVSPEEIRKMIVQHAHQNYTLQQIADIVEVDCELMHARNQKKKKEQEHTNGVSM